MLFSLKFTVSSTLASSTWGQSGSHHHQQHK